MTGKTIRIDLFSLRTPQMRAFHLTWSAFSVRFCAWFAYAPLMPVLKGELHLTPGQIANINITAVAVMILVRLTAGPLCDRFGPCKTYTGLLLLGAILVLGVALAQSYETFPFPHLVIGAIGVSFVITQYHISVMSAPNVVGTINVVAAGWGNAGGGVAQDTMPLSLTVIVMMGMAQSMNWRLAMMVSGVAMSLVAALYRRHTQDCPEGNLNVLHAAGKTIEGGRKGGWGSFVAAADNYWVWLLFTTCGVCLGVEIFIHNITTTYYVDHFGLLLSVAGMAAASFGLLALFTRALGSIVSDRMVTKRDLDTRTQLLCVLMMGEGLSLFGFAHAGSVTTAVLVMFGFGLFTHMVRGATYALMPFIDRRALDGVAGIIGAGDNAGAAAAGFLLKGMADTQAMLSIPGALVVPSATCVIVVRFSAEHKTREQALYDNTLAATGNT